MHSPHIPSDQLAGSRSSPNQMQDRNIITQFYDTTSIQQAKAFPATNSANTWYYQDGVSPYHPLIPRTL